MMEKRNIKNGILGGYLLTWIYNHHVLFDDQSGCKKVISVHYNHNFIKIKICEQQDSKTRTCTGYR